jgi:phosphate transport system protein
VGGGAPCSTLPTPRGNEDGLAGGGHGHIDREYEAELAGIGARVLEMGGKIGIMIESSLRALLTHDEGLARSTIACDDAIDRLEIETDELCLRVLARRQPVASDLRFVTTVMKMVTDLERTADMAAQLCERSLEMSAAPSAKLSRELEELTENVQGMLSEALAAFASRNAAAARRVIDRDRTVDALAGRVQGELGDLSRDNPRQVDDATRLRSVTSTLERIGDHATNLAEMVVFMVEGRDIRHVSHGQAETAG